MGQCIILPRLRCVAYDLYLVSDGGALRGRYVALSRDVARGVTFLHDHGIAHLDIIKPLNMVYTESYSLRIIDFDTSVWADDKRMIEGYIGSEAVVAPEIGTEDGPDFPYSPIKADRYSCGRVFHGVSGLVGGRWREMMTRAFEGLRSNC